MPSVCLCDELCEALCNYGQSDCEISTIGPPASCSQEARLFLKWVNRVILALGGHIVEHNIDSSPERNQRIAKTAGYFAAFVVLGLVSAALGPTLPGLAEHTGTDLAEISVLFSAWALGYLLGSLLAGWLYDRVPSHPVLTVVLVTMTAVMALVPVIPLLWLLVVVMLLLGVAGGMLDVGGNTLLVWVHRDKVGPFMNGLHFCFGLGAFLSPVIVAQAVRIGGSISWAYWVLALLILPVLVWLARLRSPKPQIASKDDPATRVDHLLVALVALFFFLYVGAETSFGGWIFSYATGMGLADETKAAYLTSAFWGALTLGRLLAVPIAARFKPAAMLVGDLAGCLVSVAVILLWPGAAAAMWIGALGLGLSMASIFPTVISLAESRMTITGRVTSWFFVGASLGSMTLPWLIGQLFESVSPRVTILAVGVNLLVAAAVFGWLNFHSKRRTKGMILE